MPTAPGPIISVQGLSKTFRIYRNPMDRLREAFSRRSLHHEHQALQDVGFELAAGEAMGIVGRNGAGKSTLLKIITGIMLPDAGQVRCVGRVTGLLELGAGFDTNLSGLQNIRANATLLGLRPHDIEASVDEIVAFSELGDYIHSPVRTYSSGMSMRLGFSVAVHALPACFIVDEALSVGDARFQQKCLKKIQEFRKGGGSLLFVSHDLNAVKVLCDRAVVLEGGRIVYQGEPEQACLHYQRLLMQLDPMEEGEAGAGTARYGQGGVRISAASLTGAQGQDRRFACGEEVRLRIELSSSIEAHNLSLGFMVRDRLGQDIFGTNTHLQKTAIACKAGEVLQVEFTVLLNLGPGGYAITFGLHDRDDYTNDVQDWWNNSLAFEVDYAGDMDFVGVCPLPVQGVQVRAC
ncbi:MAG TPA: ABC transporter ATP-binding protein [Ramlibacter sp.]|nr:ABC transporter ATP-binding protein [Ramlibacter sp.]